MTEFHVPDYFPEEWAGHEASPLPPGVEIPDYIDYAFAFRQWRLSSGALLESLNGETWPIGQKLVARCTLNNPTGTAVGYSTSANTASTNEYSAVSQLVIVTPGQAKSFIDVSIWADANTTNEYIYGKKKRPIPIGASMQAGVIKAMSGIGSVSGPHNPAVREAHLNSPPPIEDCTCGIYATRTLELLKRNARWNDRTAFVGIVKLWGVGYEGSMGYRYQYGYPDRLFTREARLVPHGERYGVPVELVEDYDDLFERFGHIER